MEQCTFCGASLPDNTSFCGNCGHAHHQEPEQTTSLVDSPTKPLENDPEGNILTILADAETRAVSDEYPRVTIGSLPTLGNGQPGGPITPPIPGEEDEEEKRRRAALLGFGPLLLSELADQQPRDYTPTSQGTPPLARVPTVSSTPQVRGGASAPPNAPSAQGSPAPSSTPVRPGSAQHPQVGQQGPQQPLYAGRTLKPKRAKGSSGCAVTGIVTAITLVGLMLVSIVLGLTVLAPTLSLSGSSTVVPGGVLRVHGDHFVPESVISLVLDSRIPVQFTRSTPVSEEGTRAGVVLGLQLDLTRPAWMPLEGATLQATGFGTIDIAITVDRHWALGTHTLLASESPTGRSAHLTFTIVQSRAVIPAPVPTTSTPPTPVQPTSVPPTPVPPTPVPPTPVPPTPVPTTPPPPTPVPPTPTPVPPTLSCVNPSSVTVPSVDVADNRWMSQTVTLCTSGRGTVSWSATVSTSWMSLSSFSGQIHAPQTQTITVYANARAGGGLAIGTHTGTVTFRDTLGHQQTLSVSFSVLTPCFTVNGAQTTSLSFSDNIASPTNTLSHVVTLSNCSGRKNWQGSSTQSWLSVSPTGGTLEVGASQTLTISVNPTGLAKATYSGTIQIIDGNYSATINVTLKVYCFSNGDVC